MEAIDAMAERGNDVTLDEATRRKELLLYGKGFTTAVRGIWVKLLREQGDVPADVMKQIYEKKPRALLVELASDATAEAMLATLEPQEGLALSPKRANHEPGSPPKSPKR